MPACRHRLIPAAHGAHLVRTKSTEADLADEFFSSAYRPRAHSAAAAIISQDGPPRRSSRPAARPPQATILVSRIEKSQTACHICYSLFRDRRNSEASCHSTTRAIAPCPGFLRPRNYYPRWPTLVQGASGRARMSTTGMILASHRRPTCVALSVSRSARQERATRAMSTLGAKTTSLRRMGTFLASTDQVSWISTRSPCASQPWGPRNLLGPRGCGRALRSPEGRLSLFTLRSPEGRGAACVAPVALTRCPEHASRARHCWLVYGGVCCRREASP